MLTPLEKALELVDKFYQTTPNEAFINEPYGIATEYKAWEQAKQCAIIAVEELIRIAPWGSDIDGEIENDSKEYYIEVKQQIEKL
jgi:hypothetical protein